MASKFSHLPDICTIQPDRLIKYRVSEDRFSAEILLPGLSYTDFDQKIGGKVSMWSLAKLFESLRWRGMAEGFMYFSELRRNKTLFVASQSVHLTQDANNLQYGTYFGLNRPLKANLHVSNVGKSSITIVLDLIDYNSGIKLATNVCVCVFVDKKQRKPVGFQEDFLVKSSKYLMTLVKNDQLTIKKAALPTIPSEAFSYEITGAHSDSDMNDHISQAIYSRWCSDAGAMGARKGYFKKFKRHIELYPIKSSEFHFIGEVLVNDVVKIYVWETSDHEDMCLQFAVTKDGKIIYTQRMEFYDVTPVQVSPHLRSKL